jgi:multiple sugar transport system ATP-binding protein
MGPEKLVTLERPDAARVTARIFTDAEITLGDTVSFGFAAEHIHLFDSEDKRIPGAGE